MNEPFDDLEHKVGRALRELPARQAPASLEGRIWRSIEQHAARPWWQRGFARWPWAARAAFALACVTFAMLTVPSSARVLRELGAFHALAAPWLQQAGAVSDVMRALAASLARFIPAGWLYAGLAASVVLYAALFGLAIAAYRLLYVHSDSSM